MTDRGAIEALETPYRIEYHDSLPSTNDRARELADAGDAGVAVVAGEQTAGRGRRGRSWSGPAGGVYCSILLEPALAPEDTPLLTLAAGVATARAATEAGVEAGIKWPNDVLVGDDERKLAGVLTERVGDRVVVGVGVNVGADPANLPEGATSLRAAGGSTDSAGFLRTLLGEFDGLASDPAGILTAWRERASTLGRRVRVETAEATIEGVATAVERPGTLVVETGDGEHRVTAGDCRHLRPA